MTRLRFSVTLNPSKTEAGDLASYGNVTFAPMDALADGLGGLNTSLERPADELAASNYSYFAEGDLLLAKVTPCFENGKKALVAGLPNRIGFATSEVHVVRPHTARVHSGYLRYLLSSETFRAAGIASMTGAGGLRRISDNAIKDFPLPVVDLDAQSAIASYLDRETARIDELITKKERQVELLDLRARQASSEVVVGQGVGSAPDVATGLEYMPLIPAHWSLRRAGHLFQQSAEPNTDDLPVLSVSIHTGISDRQLNDEERERKVTLIDDRSSYKRVRPGYLAYNMMRAWQGAVGVSTVDGAVSPAYVVAKPTRDLHSPYYQFLLRTPPFIEQMRRGSKGIADFRLRLYWEQFRLIMLPVPPLEEQERIASAAEREFSYAAELAAKVTASVDRLKERRAALITAAVAGQLDVREAAPAVVIKPDPARFRLIVGAEIVHRHQNTRRFGRIKNQKLLFLAEAHAGIRELGGNYVRFAAGPYDAGLIAETERAMEAASYFRAQPPAGESRGVTYLALEKAGQHAAELNALLGERAVRLRKLIDLLHDFDTEAVEAIATLYAVWNDALMDGQQPDDNAIVRGVLTEWHRDKAKFTTDMLRHWLDWMTRYGLTPSGQGPRTAHTMTRDMFS
jgi:type I restriction enzyme S subunit